MEISINNEKIKTKNITKPNRSFTRWTKTCQILQSYEQKQVGYFYHIFFEGCLTNFEIGGQEASKLYPEVNYARMDDYLKKFMSTSKKRLIMNLIAMHAKTNTLVNFFPCVVKFDSSICNLWSYTINHSFFFAFFDFLCNKHIYWYVHF